MGYQGRLELTWTNKDQRLLAGEDGSYEWVPPSDYRVAEVRLLHEAGTVGEVHGDRDRAKDNLLIRGDALNALTSLIELPEFAPKYVGMVSLAYLDPPFNTQQSFLHYDDALEHSVWLTMMRDRLLQIRTLLAPTGTVWLHLDDAEVHRARVVMDELFGIEQYLGTVIWQKADGPRNDLPNFSVDHDSILVYGRTSAARLNKRERDESLNAIYSSPDGDQTPWYDDNPTAPSAHRNQTWVYAIQSPITGELMYPADGRCWAAKQETVFSALSEYAQYELRIVDDDARRAQICGVPVDEVRKGIPAILLVDSVDEARASAERRRDAGVWPEFILRPRGTLGRKRPQPTAGVNTRTLWFNEDVGHNREAKAEIKALFPGEHPFATPKPERLLRRIVEAATAPGEIVLDCFLGSGTTAAVAHKLGRRWVAVEREVATVERYAVPRLQRVVSGDDLGGITTATTTSAELPDGIKTGDVRIAARVVDVLSAEGLLEGEQDLATRLRRLVKAKTARLWSGGGGFRVLDVAPSMFRAEGGQVFLSEWATNGQLAEATAAQLHYEYEHDPPFAGRRGRSRLAVIDGMLNEDVIRLLVSALPEDERLVACGTALDPAARDLVRSLRPGSTVRKIPQSILQDYRRSSRVRQVTPVPDEVDAPVPAGT